MNKPREATLDSLPHAVALGMIGLVVTGTDYWWYGSQYLDLWMIELAEAFVLAFQIRCK